MGIDAFDRERFALYAGDAGLGATAGDVLQALAVAEDLVQIAHRTLVRVYLVAEFGPVRPRVLDLFFYFGRLVAQKNGVAIGLRHLALVGAQQLGRRRQEKVGLGENRLDLKVVE